MERDPVVMVLKAGVTHVTFMDTKPNFVSTCLRKNKQRKGKEELATFNLICKNRFNVFSECTLNSGKDSGNSISVDSVSVFTMRNDSDNDSIND